MQTAQLNSTVQTAYLDNVAPALFSVTVIRVKYIKTMASFLPCGYTHMYVEN